MLKKRPFQAVLLALALHCAPTSATITLLKEGELTVTTGGFIEMDAIFDTTRSFNESIGNYPVAPPNTPNGDNGRTLFSIRNSRLDFGVEYQARPDLTTLGYFEFDLLGYNPTPPGSTGAIQTESGFVTNATVRVRQAYFSVTHDGWNGLAGQTWQLFGWQPFYFQTTVDVLPIPATPYTRTPQLRVIKGDFVAPLVRLQGAFAINRPPQRDSSVPELQAGIRISYDGWRAVLSNGGFGDLEAQPLSLAVSGLFREIVVPNYAGSVSNEIHFPATALAINAFVPILPATAEGSQNSLGLTGSWTIGNGYGDEFLGWTGGTAANLGGAVAGSLTSNLNQQRPISLDGGIGDFDSTGTFHLIQLMSFHADLEYVLPLNQPTWVDIGYARLTSNNMYLLTNDGGLTSNGTVPYVLEAAGYVNIFRELTQHIRIGLEFARVRTNYADETVAFNNRYQLSGWFTF